MQKFKAWSQAEGVYDGKHGMDEVVLTVTVEDVLWAIYTIDRECLDDEFLERVIDGLPDKMWREISVALEYIVEQEIAKDMNRERL